MSNGQISIINSPALVWYWLKTLELFTFYFFLHFPTKFDAWKCWRCCIKYQHSGDQSQHFKYNIVNWCFVWFSNLMFALLQIRFKLSLLAILLWTKHVTGSQTFCFQKSSSKIARKDYILTYLFSETLTPSICWSSGVFQSKFVRVRNMLWGRRGRCQGTCQTFSQTGEMWTIKLFKPSGEEGLLPG